VCASTHGTCVPARTGQPLSDRTVCTHSVHAPQAARNTLTHIHTHSIACVFLHVCVCVYVCVCVNECQQNTQMRGQEYGDSDSPETELSVLSFRSPVMLEGPHVPSTVAQVCLCLCVSVSLSLSLSLSLSRSRSLWICWTHSVPSCIQGFLRALRVVSPCDCVPRLGCRPPSYRRPFAGALHYGAQRSAAVLGLRR